MSPLKQSTNVAARMGRWSATHRKTAIIGWFAFVIASFAIGDRGRHEDHRPERHQRGRGPAGRPHHPRRRLQAGRADGVRPRAVEDADRHRPRVPRGRRYGDREARDLSAGHEAPLALREGQRGPGLGGRPLGPDPVQPEGHLRRGHGLHRHDRGRHRSGAEGQPRLHRRRGGLRVDRQGPGRDVHVAARPGRHDLDPDHARDPAARVRLARRRVRPPRAGAHRRLRDHGPRRPAEPDRADGRVGLRGDPPDRARGRRGLHTVLHPARTRRASGRAQRDRRARGRRGHVRPGRPHLRHHRHDRDGRHVLLRRQDVHVVRDRDDDGRRRRDDRLPDSAPGRARVAGRPRRQGARAVPRPAQAGRRREPALGRDPRRRPAPPARLGPRRDGRAARPRGTGTEAPYEPVRVRRPAGVDEGSAVVQQGAGGLPRWSHSRRRRDQGRRCRPAAPGGSRRPEAGGAGLRQGARALLHGRLARRHGAARRRPARRLRHGHRLERRTRHSPQPRSCRPRWARCRACSTPSRATRPARRTGTTR